MRFTSRWFDKDTSILVAATKCIPMGIFMGIFMAAALALGWTTTAAAWDMLPKTGQATCYKLDRYPSTTDPVTGVVTPGDVIFTDANGVTEFDPVTGNPNPICGVDVPVGTPGCFDPATATLNDPAVPCAGTGQDGESQVGLTRSIVDKGDGRIYDNNTGLMWAKKSDDGSLHDKDHIFTWDEALAFIKTMNTTCNLSQNQVDATGAPVPTVPCTTDANCPAGDKCGFAGKRDWRLPNIRELASLVNWGIFTNPAVPTPAIWSPFNTNCVPGVTVLTGSCTHSDDVTNDEHNDPLPYGTLNPDGSRMGLRVPMTYWSSTSGDAPGDAWFADYFTGDSGAHFKDVDLDVDPQAVNPADPPSPANTEVIFAGHVRAVRGPSDDDPAPKPAPAPKPKPAPKPPKKK